MLRCRWLILLCAFFVAPRWAAAETAAHREFTQVVALKPDEDQGRKLFEGCASCHGADGGGTTDGSIPRIAGQHYRVLVRQLVDFRRGARWDVRMEGVASSHEYLDDRQDIADVAIYVSGLSRDGARGIRAGEYVEQGAAIYAKACRSCHGASGEGDGARDIPRLAGQHAGYLSRQIYDAVDGRRPALTRTHRKRF